MKDKIIISDQLVARISSFISDNLGLYFPEKRHDDLRNKFYLAAMNYGFSDPEACLEWLLSSPLKQEQIETLASYLTVGETHFYRDKLIYDSLEKHVLPEIINARRKNGRYLRIWSAGCSSGEEPYSIAILLHKMLPDLEDWNISITGTDINQKALQKAEKGNYTKWSFRTAPEWMKNEYFIENQENSFTIVPFIKSMVSFYYHNLAKDPFPSLINSRTAIDILFCRNVIMYFHPGLARRIINLFYRSIANEGWLIVSGSEGYMIHKSRFVTVAFPEAIFFRKNLSRSGEIETTETTKVDLTAEYDTTLPASGSPLPATAETEETKILHTPGSLLISPTDITKKTKTTEIDAVSEASALYDLGNLKDAENILIKYLPNDKENPEAISLLAKIHSDLGQFSEAIEICRKGIEADKCNPVFYYLLALIFQEQGKMDEAISCLHNSLYLDNDHVLSCYTLGNILFQRGDMNKAGKYFSNALSLLNRYDKEIILSGSDGLSAGRLIEIIKMKDLSGNENIQAK